MTEGIFIGSRGEIFNVINGQLHMLTDYGSWFPIRSLADAL